jgi:hypothetical protein
MKQQLLLFALALVLYLWQQQSHAQALPNPVMFCTQVPNPYGFGSLVGTFGNHLGSVYSAPRGGDLYIYYPNGTLKNLTQLAGYGNTGDAFGTASQQGPTSIAVRDPSIHWDGNKALFSMVIGNVAQQYQVQTYYWQIYEVIGLGENDTPVITKVPHQPENYNNVYPIYDTHDRIIFATDRPRSGQAQHYPQRDEYESSPVTTGLWQLDPFACPADNLKILTHAPSGDFSPSIDSYGRVIFARWDHLQRDQQADGDILNNNGYGSFNYSDESAAATPYSISPDIEVFPEPRGYRTDLLQPNEIGHTLNIFNPWMMNEDGTDLETLNHIGRHEMQGYFEPNFSNDNNLQYFNPGDRYNPNNLYNFHQIRESKTQAGTYYGIDCQEFGTHAAGMIASLSAMPNHTADSIYVSYITHPSTRSADDTPSANHSGLYRDPTPLSDGRLLAVHTTETREDANEGTTANPISRYNFKIKFMQQQGNYWVAGANVIPNITKNVSYWTPDVQAHYSGVLWETFPVEVVARPRPATTASHLSATEQGIFDAQGIDVAKFQNFLSKNKLAMIVTRDVTSRDDADRQQPFNLHVSNTTKQTISNVAPTNVYDIKYLQMVQGDQIRGYGGTVNPQPGRRVIAQYMHDPTAMQYQAPTTGAQGSVNIASDGSIAAIVPAERAMSWQLTNDTNEPIVRERVWLSFVPGEVRVCSSCHGENKLNQAGLPSPTNAPLALTQLLTYLKTIDTDNDGVADINDAYPNDPTKNIAQPLTENFQAGIANWIATNGGNDATQWQTQTGDACNQTAAVINNRLSTTSGNTDQLSQTIDLRYLTDATLNFDVAYARYSNTLFDQLRVKILTCSGVSTTIYSKSGSALATAPDQITTFTPANCSQWRTECVDLSPYVGQLITLVFENQSGQGNKLYLDNVRITEIPPNEPPTVSGTNNVCSGQTSTYSISSQYPPGATFTWTVTGGTIISGQGTATVQIMWNGSGAGSLIVVRN